MSARNVASWLARPTSVGVIIGGGELSSILQIPRQTIFLSSYPGSFPLLYSNRYGGSSAREEVAPVVSAHHSQWAYSHLGAQGVQFGVCDSIEWNACFRSLGACFCAPLAGDANALTGDGRCLANGGQHAT